MGFIYEITNRSKAVPETGGLWNRVFGQVTHKEAPKPKPQRGGTLAASAQSLMHFLTAIRSGAPGGWTDDRYEQSRHQNGAAHIVVRCLGTRFLRSEFQVSHRDPSAPDGKRPVTESDPPEGDRIVRPYDLVRLLQKPNAHDYWGKLCYRVLQQKLLTGTAITWMVPNELGVPMELYCLETGIAVPMPVLSPEFPQGAYRIQPVYPYGPFSSYPLPNAAVGTLIDARWTFRSFYPHPLIRYEGYSPQTGMRLELDCLEAINRSRWYKMKRSSNPDAVLNMTDTESGAPTLDSEIERMLAQWEAAMQGPENHGKLLVPPTGAKLEQFGTVPKDMDWQAGFSQLLDFSLGGFGVPKAAAGMADDASYSQLYASLRQLDLVTMEPEAFDWAATLTRFLAPFFGDDLIVEVRCPRVDDHEITFKKVTELMGLKGLPESVIRLAFTLMDLPQDERVIKELAAVKDEQGAASGTVQALGGKSPEESGERVNKVIGEVVKREEERAEPAEISRTRPAPGKLSEGSLGPRGLSGLRKMYANGHRKVLANERK